MSTTPTGPVPPTGAPALGPPPAVANAPAGDADAASPAFRALLDSLARLARSQPRAPEVADADGLHDAIRDADQGFRQAMDLRRRLEDAFRARPS
jgi:hypothetical protein